MSIPNTSRAATVTDLSSHPPGWRVALGFVVAPGVASVLMAAFEIVQRDAANLPGYLWGLSVLVAAVGAYPAALILGIPAYLTLRHRAAPRMPYCAITGALVAVLPWFFLIFAGPNPDYASQGGIPTVIDSWRTAYGWQMAGHLLLQIATVGFVGGCVFWLIAVPRRRRMTSQ